MRNIRIFYVLGSLAIGLVITGFTMLWSYQGAPNTMNPVPQQDDFKAQWKSIDSLINLGLPKSALELTEGIYQQAKVTHNHPQFIKALLYKIKLNASFEEEFLVKTASEIEAEIKQADTPAKQLLHSILADIYWRYYQANRYKFMERTPAPGMAGDDIRTWDLKTLLDAIINDFSASLENRSELQKTNLKAYDAILDTANHSKQYRPTLYDFLAHRAVDFFMNDEASITRPAETFEIDRPAYFDPAQDFIRLELTSPDSLAQKFYALQILQDLIRFHLNDADPAALIDVNLKRLQFVNMHAILPVRDSLYLNALNQFEKNYIKSPGSTRISHAIASELEQQGQQYNPEISDRSRWKIKQAAEKCKEAIERFPKSNGAQNCLVLLSGIERKYLQLKSASVSVPDRPQLAVLDYKNTPQVHFRILNPDYDEDRQMQADYRMRNDLVEKYVSMQPVQNWQTNLPLTEDYQQHSTEFSIPSLQPGYYVLLVSSSENFDVANDYITHLSFWVSGISYVSQHTGQSTYQFYTLHRETGQPLKGVKATMFYKKYDYRTREYSQELVGNYTSNDQGLFEIPALDQGAKPNSFYLDLKYKDDRLVTDDRYYHGRQTTPADNTQPRTWFFTDRAIYRPGQTIYFKGIMLQKTGDDYQIKKNQKTTVVFNDVNYQKISELTLTSNDYGSFHGSFTAPQGVLTGHMTILNESGSVSIRMEEYKRPNFEVIFNPVKGSYKVNEMVNLTGQAKAYSGSLISGSKVNYRVVRKVYYPWRFWHFDPWPEQSTTEITNGITETDDQGDFTVSFKAVPDYQTPKKFKPVFSYTVYADIMDITGETQSTRTTVNVSYQALSVEIDLADAVNREQLDSLVFHTKNLNGQPVEASGTFTISKLQELDRLIREKYWNQTDVQIIPEEEYKDKFPNDAWKYENNPDSLIIAKTVLTQNFNSATDSVLMLANSDTWETGLYKMVVNTEDGFGEKVDHTQYFTLFSPEAKKPAIREINWFHVLKNNCEPGEKARFIMGTAAKNVHVMYEVVRENEVLKKEWLDLSNEQRILEFPVTEELRGGFSVNLWFVKYNRSFQHNVRVEVPYTNKKLDVEYITFRDKLKPGDQEEWKIRIKGKSGDKAAVELLASMYDASLDAFETKEWNFDLYQKIYGNLSWNFINSFNSVLGAINNPKIQDHLQPVFQNYDRLNWFGFDYYGGHPEYKIRGALNGRMMLEESIPASMDGGDVKMKDQAAIDQDKEVPDETSEPAAEKQSAGLELRRDFRETAFFYPDLHTDENGDVIISFEMPESLTRWKFRGLSYTQDLKTGTFEKEVVTQKELMVVPNPPRFFRQGDKMRFSAKVVNLSGYNLSGEADLKFFETTTMKDITGDILQGASKQTFSVVKNGNKPLSWQISIPIDYSVVSYHITAKAGDFTDGEEKPIPVLTNRMLVTESLPLPVKGNETKMFSFEKLKKSDSKGTLRSHKLTLEFSSNPAWYAVQALPYIMKKERESADAIFDRYYANSIASHIANSKPKIKQVFEVWKNYQPDALLSNLEKNQELKSLILQETPWVLDAKSEKEQKQRIALLFDLNRMSNEREVAFRKLQQKQSPGGGWPWFKGMPDNRYITQEIVLGFAHLKSLDVIDPMQDQQAKAMLTKAIIYLDQEMKDDYEYMLQHYKETMNEDHLSRMTIHYLLARSYFMNDVPVNKSFEEAFGYFRDQAKMYWNKQQVYGKGMIAIALNNLGVKSAPSQIMASVKEHALYSVEMGMYFRDNTNGYYWYEAPIETQALLIEAFDKIMNDKKAVEQMKIWLLKQKQTQAWKTSKATAEAVYALLLLGTDWLENNQLAEITIGDQTIDPAKLEDTKVEAGTGYFKTSWNGSEIDPGMGQITVTNKNPSIAWGAVYWQYFEDLDKITSHETPLSLKKQLFVERNTASGPVIEPVTNESTLRVGDKIKVRIELRVDRDMEFIHMKDMRASAFEPVNVLSGFRYQGGLGYYESTLDASTNFFFDYLPKGTYVFEYPLVASQKGDFSNGITTIQCIYAPEFASHSEGARVKVE